MVLIVFVFTALLIFLPPFLRSRERKRLLEAAMAAAEKGYPIPEGLIETLIKASGEQAIPTRVRDLRNGIFLIGIALGIVALSFFAYMVCSILISKQALAIAIGVG